MDTTESSAPHAHPPTEDQDHRHHDHHGEHDHRDHDHQDQPPHACYQDVVFIGRLVVGDDGEEVEVFDAVPCRRCADV